jgi:hypothetical protein
MWMAVEQSGGSIPETPGAWAMSDRSLDVRVTNLEILARTLEPLPQEVRALRHEMVDVKTRLTAVESQVVQLRGDLRDEFSAVRGEIAAQGQELRAEMAAQGQELRSELATKAELKQDIAALGMEMAAHFLEAERKTRLLLEEFLGKRRAIDEGTPTA